MICMCRNMMRNGEPRQHLPEDNTSRSEARKHTQPPQEPPFGGQQQRHCGSSLSTAKLQLTPASHHHSPPCPAAISPPRPAAISPTHLTTSGRAPDPVALACSRFCTARQLAGSPWSANHCNSVTACQADHEVRGVGAPRAAQPPQAGQQRQVLVRGCFEVGLPVILEQDKRKGKRRPKIGAFASLASTHWEIG